MLRTAAAGRPRRHDRTGKPLGGRKPSPADPINPNEIRVAELADRRSPVGFSPGPEVASREPAEDSRPAGVGALPLEGVIDLFHRIRHRRRRFLSADSGGAGAGRRRGVGDPNRREPLAPNQTRIAPIASPALIIELITTPGQPIVHP